jgi:hypothetical protein
MQVGSSENTQIIYAQNPSRICGTMIKANCDLTISCINNMEKSPPALPTLNKLFQA